MIWNEVVILPEKCFTAEKRENTMSNIHPHIFDLKITVRVGAGIDLKNRVEVGLGNR